MCVCVWVCVGGASSGGGGSNSPRNPADAMAKLAPSERVIM